MSFMVLTAKLMDVFLMSNYIYKGDHSFVSVFILKLSNYPLFFNKSIGTSSTKMALKFLQADFVRIIKQLGLSIKLKEQRFNDCSDLVRLIDIIYEQYLKL